LVLSSQLSALSCQFLVFDYGCDLLPIFCLLISHFIPGRLVSWPELGSLFLLRGESECTGERAGGQFSIFGAIEENAGQGFPESARVKVLVRDATVRRMQGWSSVCGNG
jgi:hypothetical protein